MVVVYRGHALIPVTASDVRIDRQQCPSYRREHEPPRGRREQVAGSAAQGRPCGLRGRFRQIRMGEPDGHQEGSDGASSDLARRGGCAAQARRNPLEYTGGITGSSLALVCAAKGYPSRIVASDAFSREKLDQMRAPGAELTLVPSEGGLTTKKLILDMIEAARLLSREPNTCWTGQLNNRETIAGCFALGVMSVVQLAGLIVPFVR